MTNDLRSRLLEYLSASTGIHSKQSIHLIRSHSSCASLRKISAIHSGA